MAHIARNLVKKKKLKAKLKVPQAPILPTEKPKSLWNDVSFQGSFEDTFQISVGDNAQIDYDEQGFIFDQEDLDIQKIPKDELKDLENTEKNTDSLTFNRWNNKETDNLLGKNGEWTAPELTQNEERNTDGDEVIWGHEDEWESAQKPEINPQEVLKKVKVKEKMVKEPKKEFDEVWESAQKNSDESELNSNKPNNEVEATPNNKLTKQKPIMKSKSTPQVQNLKKRTDSLASAKLYDVIKFKPTGPAYGPDPLPEKIRDIKRSDYQPIDKEYLQSLIKGKFDLLQNTESKRESVKVDELKENEVYVDYKGRHTIDPISVISPTNKISVSNPTINYNLSPVLQKKVMMENQQRLPDKPAPPLVAQHQIRGVPRPVSFIGSQVSKGVYTAKYFECYYYPPNHVRAYYRKSKAAILVSYTEGHQMNNPNMKIPKNEVPKSATPRDYGFFRAHWRRMIRQVFLNSYNEIDGLDGLFQFYVDIYPTTQEEKAQLQMDMTQCLENFKAIDFTNQIKRANARMRWPSFYGAFLESKVKTFAVPPYMNVPSKYSKLTSIAEYEEEVDEEGSY